MQFGNEIAVGKRGDGQLESHALILAKREGGVGVPCSQPGATARAVGIPAGGPDQGPSTPSIARPPAPITAETARHMHARFPIPLIPLPPTVSHEPSTKLNVSESPLRRKTC